MVATLCSAMLLGVEAQLFTVEVDASLGMPILSIIGLGDTAVHEARYRIQCALRASELELPHKRVTINLAPAAIRKDGASLDLPMALGLLIESALLPAESVEGTLAVGELALTGQLRPVRGVLAVAALVKKHGLRRLIVPAENAPEARVVEGIEVLAPARLSDLLAHLRGERPLPVEGPGDGLERAPPSEVDLSEVKGQALARRALEIAAAGGHNLLLVGPPGSGKTMLARRLPTILPPMTAEEQVEVTQVWSAAGLTIGRGGLITSRPFRAPHHTISEAGLIGGGTPVRPGEISLAHHGVLFLDEMPELPRRVLEALRQPMEEGSVVIARVRQNIRLPSSFMLVGAANPCPCGWVGDPGGRCSCTEGEIARYTSRLSGPLLDRIDMVVEAPTVRAQEMISESQGEGSEVVRTRVCEARERAHHRGVSANARLAGSALLSAAQPTGAGRKLLLMASERFQLSARVVARTLRLARTLADLAGSHEVGEQEIAEALRYRPRLGWSSRGNAGEEVGIRVGE